MARHSIEIVIEFLDVLAVVALLIGETEQALLQDWVLAVPKGKRKTKQLAVIAEAGDAILAPAIGTAARMVVGEMVPRGPTGAVILPHRAPLAFADIGPPASPVFCRAAHRPQALAFRIGWFGHQL